MKSLEDKIKRKLSEQGMTIQRLAIQSGISEPTLHAIINRDDAKLSQLEKIADALGVTLSYFMESGSTNLIGASIQTGNKNQADTGNTQKIRVGKGAESIKELAAELATCRRELALTQALVDAKDETIALLRDSYSRPN